MRIESPRCASAASGERRGSAISRCAVTLLALGASLVLGVSTARPACLVILSEVVASNRTTILDEDGDSPDWVELLNDCDTPVNLDGWFLTDDPSSPAKWRFPAVELGAGEFLVVFCSAEDRRDPAGKLHTNFELDQDGEYVALVRPDGTVEWQFAPQFPALQTDVSYGLVHEPPGPIQTEHRHFFPTPTPAAPNGTGFDSVAPKPTASPPGGAYSEDSSVELSVPSGEGVVHYTLNGTEPRETSPVFSDLVLINATTELRAKTFEAGRLPGPTVTHHYLMISPSLLDFDSDLPLVLVYSFGAAIPENSFTRAQFQIIERGEDGRTRPMDGANFSGIGGIKIRGFSSVSRPKKSYSLEVWDAYREDRDVEILGMPAGADWTLYGPYQFDRALMRNAFIYELSNQIGRYASRTRFVEAFVNMRIRQSTSQSDYLGVYALVERIKRGPNRVDIENMEPSHDSEPLITGGYIVQIDRLDEDEIGLRAGGHVFSHEYPREENITAAQKAWLKGYLDDFNAALLGPDFRDPDVGYAAYINVGSFVDHHIINEFSKNPDAFRLSTYMHKKRQGKLQAGPVWDFDRTMGPDDDGRAANPVGWSGLREFGWYARFFDDPDFDARYRDRWLELRLGSMSLENMHGIVDSMANEIAEAQVRNFQRWSLPLGAAGWAGKIEDLKQWIADRLTWIDGELLDPPVLSSEGGMVALPFEVIISMRDAAGEIVYTLNGLDPRAEDGGTVEGALNFADPIVVTENTRVRARTRFGSGKAWSPLVEATYVVSTLTIALTEIMYNPPGGTDFEFLELFNFGDTALDLEDSIFELGFDFEFTDSFVVQAGEYVVLVNDLGAFSSRYDASRIRVAGEYEGVLSNTSETLELLGPVSEPLFEVKFDDGWFPETDGGGHSLVLLDPESPPEMWRERESWRASFLPNGSPGEEDPTDVAEGGQVPGDGNQDGELDMADAVHLLMALFGVVDGRRFPCADSAATDAANILLLDANGDDVVNTDDAIYNLTYLYLGGPAPEQGLECRALRFCPEVCVP